MALSPLASSPATATPARPVDRPRVGAPALGAARLNRWGLAAVIGLALAVRWWGLDYSLPAVYYPDEGKVMEDVRAMVATGSLRPEYFTYPQFWLYVLAALVKLGAALSLLVGAPFGAAPLDNPTFVYGTGRAAAAVAGTLTLIPLYLVAERVGRAFGLARPAWIGLLACAFLALAPLHVQHAKIASPDAPTTAFLTLALYACLRIFDDGRTRWYVLAALATGAAAGTKYPSALAAITIAAAHLARHWRAGGGPLCVARGVVLDYRIWLAGLLTAGFFLATSPYVLLDYERFRAALAYESGKAFERGVNGQIGSAGRAEGALFVPTVLHRGLDTPVALLAGLGLGWAAWTAARRPHARGYVALLLTYPLLVYVFTWSWRMAFSRYVLPIVPFACVFAALGVGLLASSLAARRISSGPGTGGEPAARPALAGVGLAALVAGAIALGALAWQADGVARYNAMLTRPDTRTLAADWLNASVPPNETVWMEWYTPPYRNGRQLGWELSDRSVERQRSRGARYIMTSSFTYDRWLSAPERYPSRVTFYRTLDAEATTLYQVAPNPDLGYDPLQEIWDGWHGIPFGPAARPGPRLTVYRLDQGR